MQVELQRLCVCKGPACGHQTRFANQKVGQVHLQYLQALQPLRLRTTWSAPLLLALCALAPVLAFVLFVSSLGIVRRSGTVRQACVGTGTSTAGGTTASSRAVEAAPRASGAPAASPSYLGWLPRTSKAQGGQRTRTGPASHPGRTRGPPCWTPTSWLRATQPFLAHYLAKISLQENCGK